MLTWLRRLWNDEAAFRAALRGVLVVLGQLLAFGVLDGHRLGLTSEQAAGLGAFLTGGAVAIPAGQQNRPPA